MSHHRIAEIQKVVTFCCNMSDNILRTKAISEDVLLDVTCPISSPIPASQI